jgi:PAS domain S-box-containing protein
MILPRRQASHDHCDREPWTAQNRSIRSAQIPFDGERKLRHSVAKRGKLARFATMWLCLSIEGEKGERPMLPRSALHRLVDQAAGAGSLDAVYQTALKCVQDGLNVERASLLVFDATGTVRFVAWSGLSEAYREAVDGHSPWTQEETNATPLLVEDVEQDAALAAYLPVFRRERIRAAAFVPVQFGLNLLGKFMLYYSEPHAFPDGEIAVAQQIADHVASALVHHRVSVALEAQLVAERELRQRAEAEAVQRQESESRLHLALAAGNMGVWEWDIASGRVSWSEDLELLHGLEPGLFGGTLNDFRRDVHPDDIDRLERTIAAAIEAPETRYHVEYRTTLRDGACRWMACNGRVVIDSAGTPIRMLGICRDVTKRKRAEDAVREADQRKDDFLATLAHELRNPLVALRAGAVVIRKRSRDPETVLEYCTIMERQLQQLTRLVDDLLDVSNLAHRGLALQKSRIELEAVVRMALEQSHFLIEEAGHELSVRLPKERIFLEADAVRLGQVLTNLLSNAVKYTPHGGKIELAAERGDQGVWMRVKDSGLGIPPDKLDSIFEMFGQLDRSAETGYKGLGIGLTLVKALVRMHGGTVEAHSEGPGKGSVFRVWLPTVSSGEAVLPSDAQEKPSAHGGGNCRVLLVDDNHDVAKAMARWIRLLGHDIRVAFDGPEAMLIAGEFNPDIVLMDIGLPKLNGYDVAREMRSKPWGRTMTLVAVTGWGRDADRRQSQEAGFDQHLTKPVEPGVLEALLDNCSKRAAAEAEARVNPQ